MPDQQARADRDEAVSPASARRAAVDAHIGTRMRQRRMLLGMSQDKLGEALGLTFQQVQKYERGTNRLCASRLWQVGQVLGVAPDWFFEGLDINGLSSDADSDSAVGPAFEGRRETLELVRALDRIQSPTALDAMEQLILAAADLDPSGRPAKV